jgi:ADP-ribose diphosphatase
VVSYSTEAIEFFVARGLTHVGARLDAGEFLDIEPISVAAMQAAIDRGEITDAKTVAAFLLYARLPLSPARSA